MSDPTPADANMSPRASSEAEAPSLTSQLSPQRLRTPLPAGYRQGIITAITVFIGFSLAFLRFWAFEAPGDWTPRSIGALVILLIPICAQINALYRALLPEDDDAVTYGVTVKWFIWSVCGMLLAVCLAAMVLSGVFEP